MSDTVFLQRSSSGGCYAILIVLLVFPVMFLTAFLQSMFGSVAVVIGVVTILAMVVLAAATAFLVRSEYRLELGASTVRFTERDVYLGVARPEVLKFEVPLTSDTQVKQVNTRTPASRGGWNHGSALHFPGGHEITDYFLGSREDPKSEYNRLTKALKQRLGDRFSVEEKV